MSIKQTLSLVAAGICVGYLGVQFYQNYEPRQPASETGKSKIWSSEKFGKSGQAILVSIYTASGVPERDEQELVLRADVQLKIPIDGDLEYEWLLPEGVSVVSGEKKDVLTGMRPMQMAKLEITLQNISKEGFAKTVTLQVSGKQGSIQYGGIGHFATNSHVQMAAAMEKERDQKVDSEFVKPLSVPKIKE
jgi:hypothetical protein